MSLQFQKCYLEAIKIVINHDIKPDLVLNYGSFFKNTATTLNSQLINNNTPNEAPPEIPRIVVSNKEITISFSLNRIEIQLIGVRKHGGKWLIKNIFSPKIDGVIKIVESYFNLDNFNKDFVGILGALKFPQDIQVQKNDLIKELAKIYSNKFLNQTLVTYLTRVGFLSTSSNEFVNFEISNYEVKNIQMTTVIPGNVINLDQFPTVEHGIQFALDVNDRPKGQRGSVKDDILNACNCFFDVIEQIDTYR